MKGVLNHTETTGTDLLSLCEHHSTGEQVYLYELISHRMCQQGLDAFQVNKVERRYSACWVSKEKKQLHNFQEFTPAPFLPQSISR